MRRITTIQTISFLMLFLMLLSPMAFASELKMIKASELKPGQVIVDKEGNEIKVENVETKEKHYTTISEIINNLLGTSDKSKNNINVYAGAGQNGAGIVDLTGMVVGGGITGKAIETGLFNKGVWTIDPEGGYYRDSSTGNYWLTQYGPTQPTDSARVYSSPTTPTSASTKEPAPAQTSSPTTPTSASTKEPAPTPAIVQAPTAAELTRLTLSTEEERLLARPHGGLTYLTSAPEETGSTSLLSGGPGFQLKDRREFETTPLPPGLNEERKQPQAPPAPAPPENMGPGWFNFGNNPWGYSASYVVQGAIWAAAVAEVVGVFGGYFASDNPAEVRAIQAAVFAGFLAGRSVMGGLFGQGSILENNFLGSGWGQLGVGLATAWLVYNSQWEKVDSRIETVSFKCMPWQAPHGGKDCELCNSDSTLPCSEYRCKSLGQTCGIINAGTSSEKCVNQNIRDVTPPIINPWSEALTPTDLKYADVKSNPPGAGFKIKSSQTLTGCIKPYTPITFGIETNEPSQCKIDYVEGKNYSKMATYFGGSNIYNYNHTESISLPSADFFKNSSITLQNGKELKLYIKCRDSLGNVNEADYAMSLCVDPSDDTTPPRVSVTSVPTGSCVAATSMNSTAIFYINEPAECKWSTQDQNYNSMQNNMSCATSTTEINTMQLYPCKALLTGISQSGSDFYIRCRDQPGINETKRNTNAESYKFNLRSSNPLKMGALKPNGTIYGVLSPMPVELSTSTLFGCDNGQATCFYSTTGAENSYVKFFDTATTDGIHTQRLDLTRGSYTYYVKCVDAGGNVATAVANFVLDIDQNNPLIARVYEEDDYLKIVTSLNSECFFSNENCDFLNEGSPMPYANSTTHVTPWFSDKTYYIKCQDEYRSLPTACSLVVRPTENFL